MDQMNKAQNGTGLHCVDATAPCALHGLNSSNDIFFIQPVLHFISFIIPLTVPLHSPSPIACCLFNYPYSASHSYILLPPTSIPHASLHQLLLLDLSCCFD